MGQRVRQGYTQALGVSVTAGGWDGITGNPEPAMRLSDIQGALWGLRAQVKHPRGSALVTLNSQI